MRAPDTFVRMRKDGCRETVPPAASGLKDLCEVESAEMEYAGEVPEELEEQQDELYEHFAVTVDRGQAMLRIDKYLAVRLENCSRSRVQAAADSGNILVNGIPVKSSYKVKPLDRIALVMPYPKREVEIIPEDIPLDILYEDDDLIVLNKPAGLVVHPGHGNYSGTLVNALTWHLKDLPLFQEGDMRAGLVHRIDKNTSGLLVVAKNERAHARLARQFFDHTVSRRYVALVWGNFEEDEGTVTGNIGRSVRDRLRMAVYPDGSDGKHAVTHYRVLKRYGYVTLVECRLETGRTHQIRVHMEYIGHPLFNDERYGGDRILKGTTFAKYKQFIDNCFSVMPRHALHARSLGFEHPSTRRRMEFDSELPADFRAVLDKWDAYTAAGRRRKSSGAAPYVGGDSCRRTGAAVLFAGCSPCSCGCLDTDGRCGGRLRNGFCTVRGGGCVPTVVFSYNAVRHGREDFHHHQAECRCNGCYGPDNRRFSAGRLPDTRHAPGLHEP